LSSRRPTLWRKDDWPALVGWAVVLPALLLLWQLGATRLAQPWILPRASDVLACILHPLRDVYASGSLLGNTAVSFVRVVVGFALGALVAVPLGIAMGAMRTVRGFLEPLLELLRPLCPIAWIPFAIAVFKLTTIPNLFGVRLSRTVFDHVQLGMVFVLFWGAFFPILVNTVDGVSGVRDQYRRLAQTLGASRAQVFRHVYLPASFPMILTGLRQGIGTCWFVIIAAEMLPGSDSGVGYLLMYASDQCGMDIVIACMIIIAAIGALLNAGMMSATRRLVRWHGKEM